MKAVSGKVFCKLLEKKGWHLARVQGSHHIYIKEGEPARISVPVHSSRALKKGLQRHIMKLSGIMESEL